jgi:hypothetical protein
MTYHDPGSGVPLVPCDCGCDCEFVETDCCTDAQWECETELTVVVGWEGEIEDRIRVCGDGFGCNIQGVPA